MRTHVKPRGTPQFLRAKAVTAFSAS